MPSTQRPGDAAVEAFVSPPDPRPAGTVDDLVERLRLLKVWSGDPSYVWIRERVDEAWIAAGRPAGELVGTTTVKDLFRRGRRRLNTDLVIAVVRALHPDLAYVTRWQQTLRVIDGETRAATQVRVQDTLPQDLVGFTGRAAELDRLRRALHEGRRDGRAVVVSAIAGMAGVGKTELAIHAGHLLARDGQFDRVLFVNLRGFHPDPAQPPADPAAVLDGFLRLLGVAGHRIPRDLPARVAAYRDRLAGTHTLVVLDNAADEDQVRPLVPETPGCLTLVTSRRDLAGLHPAIRLTVDVFTPDEALTFLTRTLPQVPVGQDSGALARIAHRCGYLPLALGLVAEHIGRTSRWTLTEHAGRLDERTHDRRMDTGVQLALDLSYQHLSGDRQRLLRLVALHPGPDLDAHAAAALAGDDLFAIRAHLRYLCGNHLLQRPAPGRYTLHDLVRAYAASRGSDEDPPSERRAAQTSLFDYYLAATGAAVNTLYPAEAHRRPRVPTTGTAMPELTDPESARVWLDAERPTLVAVAERTATHGWPTHTTRLSATLYRYLDGGHATDGLTVHGHALYGARQSGDLAGQGEALCNLGVANLRLSRCEPAGEHFHQALHLLRQVGDQIDQARALAGLGAVEERLGRYQTAVDHLHRALTLYRQIGDRIGEARSLGYIGHVEGRLGRHQPAIEHLEEALALFRQVSDRSGEVDALVDLGAVKTQLGQYRPAAEQARKALTLSRQLGNRDGEADALDVLAILHTRRGRPAQAIDHHQQALAVYRETGNRDGEAWALNGLGEATHAAGRATDALIHHTAAHTIAADIHSRDQQARAHNGLGRAHHTLGDLTRARQYYQQALTVYTHLGMPDADRIRAHLAAIDDPLADVPTSGGPTPSQLGPPPTATLLPITDVKRQHQTPPTDKRDEANAATSFPVSSSADSANAG
jgi:tetratricopeptide (TPR) repeat protein